MSDNAQAVARVRQVIDRLAKEGIAVSDLDGKKREIFPKSVSPAEGEAIRDWVHQEGASRTIETGLAYGHSALHICEGLLSNGQTEPRHVAIDPFQRTEFGDCALQFLDEAGVAHMVEHHPEESQIVLPALLSKGLSFDFAFVDGDHRFEGVFLDLYYLGRLVRPGGIVILDDYQVPAVARAVSYFLSNREWKLEEISVPDEKHQWAVVRTPLTPDEHPWTYFVEF